VTIDSRSTSASVAKPMSARCRLTARSSSPRFFASGSIGRFGFLGVTRDVNGTAVGGVTVKLYHTADDTVVCSTVSDPLGNFGVTTQFYPDAHYMVAYKSGAPDIEGTTANTLIPG
jgi:hypothetical protein